MVRGNVKKKMVDLDGTNQKGDPFSFCLGIFFCLESPDHLLTSSKIEHFSNSPSEIIECLYRKSAWQPIFDNS